MNLCKLAKPSQKLMPALTLSCFNNSSLEGKHELTRCRHYHTSIINLKNHYDVLGVTPKASQTQIKTSYYKLSKQFHPDVNKSDDAKKKFAEISEAYEVLGNKSRRRAYDNVAHGSARYGGGLSSAVRAKRTTTDHENIQDRAGQFKERRQSPMTGKTAQFDFDEFYRQHYGEALHDTRNLRARQKKYREKSQVTSATFKGRAPTQLYVVVFILLGLTVIKEVTEY